MAQLKSTSVVGNLAVTGNVVASKIITNNNTNDEILLSNGDTISHNEITANILNAQAQAGNAVAAASAAQSTATTALSNASTAQSTATTAIADAAAAQSTANTALSNAAIADGKAVNAQKAADNADSKAGNAHAYARKVYGDDKNETPAYTVTKNAADISALTETHGKDVKALGKRIDDLGDKHNNELAAAINQHNLDKDSLQTQIDIKLFNNQDDEITGTLTAQAFIRAAVDGIANSTSLLVADGTVQPKLNFDDNVAESTPQDGFVYDTPILTGLTLDSPTNKITAQRRALKDLGINLIYKFKDSINSEHFKNISSASVGDVYHINDDYISSGTTILAKGSDWVCHTPLFSSIADNFDTLYDLYWQPLASHIDLSGYLAKSGGFITDSILRNITSSSLNTPMIKLGSANQNVDLFRITNSNGNGGLANIGQYGYNLRYTGSASTKNLQLLCDNSAATTQQIGWELNQEGQMGIGMSPNSSHRVTINGSIYLNHNTSTLLAVPNDTVLSMDSSKYLTLRNKNQIQFLTSTKSKTTIYDVDGNWTMPNNLILNKGAVDDVYIELRRREGADWKILSSGGNLAIQCNYTTAGTTKSYYSVIEMAYDTGNITTRGSILPAANNIKQLGSSSYKWNALYSTNVHSTTVNATTVNLNTAQNSSGGIIDFTSNKNIGSITNIWNTANVYQLNLHRGKSAAGGRISFYNGNANKNDHSTWFEYMGSNALNQPCPTGGTPSKFGSVDNWALRSLVEMGDNYGWIWESAVDDYDNTTATNPTAMMALSAQNGNLFLRGSLTLSEKATFKYNTSDKCIDVLFT